MHVLKAMPSGQNKFGKIYTQIVGKKLHTEGNRTKKRCKLKCWIVNPLNCLGFPQCSLCHNQEIRFQADHGGWSEQPEMQLNICLISLCLPSKRSEAFAKKVTEKDLTQFQLVWTVFCEKLRCSQNSLREFFKSLETKLSKLRNPAIIVRNYRAIS